MTQTILCYGNEHFPGDEVAKVIGTSIAHHDFNFVAAESPYDILKVEGDVLILDVVKGIESVQLLTIDDLKNTNSVTVHDLDLGFFLTLLQETNQIEEVRIIGIPYGETDLVQIEREVMEVLAYFGT